MPCATCCQATDWSTSRQVDPDDAAVLDFVDRFPAIRDLANALTPITWHVDYDGSQYMAEWGDTGSMSRDPRGRLALYDLDNDKKLKWRANTAAAFNSFPPTLETTNLFVTSDAVWLAATSGGNNTTIRHLADGSQSGLISGSAISPTRSQVHGVYLHTFSSSRIRRYDKSGTQIDQSDNTGARGFPASGLNYLAKTGTTYDELTDLTDLTVETGYTAAGAGTVTWIGADNSGLYRLRQLALGGDLFFEKYKAGSELFSVNLGTSSGFTDGHVFGGLVFLRNSARTNLSCRDVSDGSEKWSDSWSLDQSRSRVIKSVLYMPTLANDIRAVDPDDGSVIWTSATHECVTGDESGSPAIIWLGGNRVAN